MYGAVEPCRFIQGNAMNMIGRGYSFYEMTVISSHLDS